MSSADYDVAYCDACERCHLNGICPLTDKAQKVVSMTDAGWAEKAAKQCFHTSLPWERAIANRLKAEHARAVRICRQARMLKFHGLRDTDTNEWLDGYEAACCDILAALQRGRGGKG